MLGAQSLETSLNSMEFVYIFCFSTTVNIAFALGYVQLVGSCFDILRDIDHFCWTQRTNVGVSEQVKFQYFFYYYYYFHSIR